MHPKRTRPVLVERTGDRRPMKPKSWSHQDELLAARGKIVKLFTANGTIAGKLLNADNFTIQLQIDDGESKSQTTYYKHAIRAFHVVDAA